MSVALSTLWPYYRTMIKNETKTTVKYNHILTQDFLIEADYYGEEVWEKAGKLLKTTKDARKYVEYFAGYIAHGIGRTIPGDLVKVVKVTTTTVTEEEEVA